MQIEKFINFFMVIYSEKMNVINFTIKIYYQELQG